MLLPKCPDTAQALVMTLNLSAYPWKMSDKNGQCAHPCQFWGPGYPNAGNGTRDFGIVVTGPDLVAAIANIFYSDFGCAARDKTNDLKDCNNGLVWSNGTTGIAPASAGNYPADGNYPMYDPSELEGSVDQGNARDVHLEVIRAAQKTLVIYNEEMGDDQIVDEIAKKAGSGIAVQVLMTGGTKDGSDGPYYNFDYNFQKIAEAGGLIRLFPNSAEFMYIHAKVLLADARTEDAMAFVGSQNISGNSLDFNRELGVVLRGPKSTHLLIETFDSDRQIAGLIQWPINGSIIYPKEHSKHVVNADQGAASNADKRSTTQVEKKSTVPMKCGPVQPRHG